MSGGGVASDPESVDLVRVGDRPAVCPPPGARDAVAGAGCLGFVAAMSFSAGGWDSPGPQDIFKDRCERFNATESGFSGVCMRGGTEAPRSGKSTRCVFLAARRVEGTDRTQVRQQADARRDVPMRLLRATALRVDGQVRERYGLAVVHESVRGVRNHVLRRCRFPRAVKMRGDRAGTPRTRLSTWKCDAAGATRTSATSSGTARSRRDCDTASTPSASRWTGRRRPGSRPRASYRGSATGR